MQVRLSHDLLAFSQRLGHQFTQPEFLIRALTHGSITSETRPDNQRLEFLGDRVLGLVMAEAVLTQDSNAKEGQLAPRFNALVRKETCAEIARTIDLGAVLRLGKSEAQTGGRRKTALLADAMEAVIAAVYLDGGLEAAKRVMLRLWQDHLTHVAKDARDAKSTLQEWAQARGHPPPTYTEVAREGPDHAPVFEIEVRLHTGETAKAKATSKRHAEQQAAQTLLTHMSGGAVKPENT